jgi:PAS domain S-box-containing protein
MLDSYKYASANLERLGEYEQALKYYKNYSALNDSLFNEKSKQHIDYMTLVLENQERDKELSQLENQQKVLKLESKNRSLFFLTAITILIIVVVFFSWRYNLKKKSEMNLTKQYHTLLETEQKVKALLDASFDSTLLVDTQGKILTANNNDLNGFFQDAELMINKDISSFFTKTNSKVLHQFLELVLASLEPKETHIKEKNQTLLDIKISPVIDHNQQVTSLAFYIKDITQIERDKKEKKIMQNQLIQSQKMETVGTLAGGIAHDFNNYLATISGYLSMSLEDVDPDTHVYKYLTNSKKAVVLAQDTVKKLLAFSRSNEIYFDKLSSKNLIKDCMDMIKGAKPKNIVLKYPKDSKDYGLLADKNQLTQVIINICTNAFHAIGKNKGEVEITITEILGHPEFSHKRMLRICIKDNGIGMDNETKKRIFEPFFTTKDVGQGTGLGLSAASGIIKQHKGKIEVQSEFGEGTSFSLFLPIIS